MKFIIKNKKGFSLIEVLAVLFVVSLGMVGVVSLIIQNIQVQSINKNNFIAYNLAQEGIELIRRSRDSQWREGRNIEAALMPGLRYRIDYRQDDPEVISNTSEAKIYLFNNFYINSTGAESPLIETPFSREIFIDKLNSYDGNPLQVRSVVSWLDRGKPHSYELRTLLFDWR